MNSCKEGLAVVAPPQKKGKWWPVYHSADKKGLEPDIGNIAQQLDDRHNSLLWQDVCIKLAYFPAILNAS